MGNSTLFLNKTMRVLAILLLVCMVGLAYQQLPMTCGRFEVHSSTGMKKYRMKPRASTKAWPGYCTRRVHRRLQQVQEPMCGHRRLAESRRMQFMEYCPVVNGWQCYRC